MSNNVHILELSGYEAPVIKESKRDNWVEYGDDNNYYGYLIDRYTNSTTNNAIINNVIRLVYGRGLSATDANRKPNEYAHMMALLSKECVRHLCTDIKLLGQCAMQVIYTKDRKKIAQVHHIPVQLLRAEKCNEDGKVEGYYYSDDWTDTKKYEPKRISAFGCSNDPIEIFFVKPYSVGLKYYALVDYTGGIPYAVLEEDISEYLINECERGFSGRSVVNFNNGVPAEEQQLMIKNKVLSQLTGTTGDKVIVSFNNNQDSKTTVDAMPVNDAPDLYSTLSEECLRKIMLSHNVTSPLLFGIASSNGFSSNADELKDSFALFSNMIIAPMQELLLDAFEQILAYNGISLNLFFRTLKPLEFVDLENAVTEEQVQEETGLELNKDFSDKEGEQILDHLEGEEIDENWELVDERAFKNENGDLDEWIEEIDNKKSKLRKLADVIKSFPSRSSQLDKSIYKVRYKYSQKYSSGNSRDFCKTMMARTNRGVVYRLEDIDKASREGVNKKLGHKGQSYDLFKFKGGVNCGHYWSEQLYRLKKKKDGSYYEDKALSSSEEVESIPKSYKPTPRGRQQAKIAPKDMPDNGHHPNYKG
ncbi:MAG: hypothetical protein GY861_15465 [bacterium]|nr:hypothetical protein [bacterium]